MIITLDELTLMWESDSSINLSVLNEDSRKFANIHSKYLALLSNSRVSLKNLEMQYAELRRDKWLYYNGKMTQAEMLARNWKYDPFNGMSKPLKGDLDLFYNADYDIQKMQSKMEYVKILNQALEEILDTLRWRHNAIKNIIDFNKFTAGN